MIILAITIVVIGMLLSSAFQMLKGGETKTRSLQAQDLVQELGKASQLVFQEGAGARTKVYITIPAGIVNYTQSGDHIMVNISLGQDITPYRYDLSFPATVTLPSTPNSYWINITATTTGVIIS